MRNKLSLVVLLLCCCLLANQAWTKPSVIAHRGASGYLPEHTLAAAVLAYAQGADFIEQDLVLSKDFIPIVLHDIHLESVTNVEQVFPDRHRSDGRFYAIDFTLAELKQLHKHERTSKKGQVFPQRYAGLSPFQVATFEEHIQLISQLNRQFNKDVGLYPEIKAPGWHKKQGADISQIVLNVLRKHSLDDPTSQVFVQCFDFAEVQRLRLELGAKVKLVQLLDENSWNESSSDYSKLKGTERLKQIAEVAQGIGPWIPQLVDLKTGQPSDLASLAKQQGLLIHPYTFRLEQLPNDMTSTDLLDLLFKRLQVDGIFTDFTDVVTAYVQAMSQKPKDSDYLSKK